MMWGGIRRDGRTALVIIETPPGLTADRYVEEVLEPHVLSQREEIGEGFILQQDNARPHIAQVTREFLQAEGIEVLVWPANSPDLNPIEHLWDELKRRVNKRNNRNLQELRQAIIEEWHNIPQDLINKIIKSMRRRCQAVLAANGGATRY